VSKPTRNAQADLKRHRETEKENIKKKFEGTQKGAKESQMRERGEDLQTKSGEREKINLMKVTWSGLGKGKGIGGGSEQGRGISKNKKG